MLRKLEMTWILMVVATCLAGTGCSSLFLPDGGELTADNSRLVDMRPSNLESLVAEEVGSQEEPADLSNGRDDSIDLLGEPTGLVPEGEPAEVNEETSASGGAWQVNHEAGPALEPLQVQVSPKEIAGGAGEGVSEKIIILKAKSTNPTNVREMIAPLANPASPPAPDTTRTDPAGGKPNPLAPINWGSDLAPVYSNFEPARLVCGASCECDECQAVNAGGDADEAGKTEPATASELLPDGSAGEAAVDEVENAPDEGAAELESEGANPPMAADENQFEPVTSELQLSSETDSHEPEPEATTPPAAPSDAVAGTGELVAAEPANLNAETQALPWDIQLKATITAFENQIIDLTLSDYRRPKLQQSLAILQALEDRLSSGRIALEQPKHRQYWQHQMTAILNMLQAAKTNGDGGRENVSEAISQLKSAVIELQQLSELSITRLEFCSEVSGYGQFVTMDRDGFLPESKTLVYCEIENFVPVIEKVGEQEMYATRLECRLEVFDLEEKKVQTVDFPMVEDLAINHRRDFYMHLPLTWAQLPSGDYQVHLRVKDIGSQKTAHHEVKGRITIKPGREVRGDRLYQ